MPSRMSETNRARSYDTRQNRGASLSGPTPKAMIDKYSIIPILACVFTIIVSSLEYKLFDLSTTETRLDNRLFWPVMAAISVILAVQRRSRLRKPLPPHIICLLVYLAFAAASVLWSFNKEASFIRFSQQAMVITSI